MEMATRELIKTGTTKNGHPLKMVAIGDGLVVAGAGMRKNKACIAVTFSIDGVDYGQRFPAARRDNADMHFNNLAV